MDVGLMGYGSKTRSELPTPTMGLAVGWPVLAASRSTWASPYAHGLRLRLLLGLGLGLGL